MKALYANSKMQFAFQLSSASAASISLCPNGLHKPPKGVQSQGNKVDPLWKNRNENNTRNLAKKPQGAVFAPNFFNFVVSLPQLDTMVSFGQIYGFLVFSST
jgi:hypothetical protein